MKKHGFSNSLLQSEEDLTESLPLRFATMPSDPTYPVEVMHESRESRCLSLIQSKAYAAAAEMAQGLNVLDLGCNNGYGTRKIAERCAYITGADISKKAIEEATDLHGGPNIKYQIVNGRKLPFPEKQFDLVISFQVIEHVEFVQPYLHEIRRVLRDAGRALFTTPNRCIRLEPGMKPWNRDHVREFDTAELEQTLRSVFDDVIVQGLFASPELYNIEFQRVARAKKAAQMSRVERLLRRPVSTARAAFVRSTIWDSFANRMRDAEKNIALVNYASQWSLSDLFYSSQDLDKALDLLAIGR